MLSKIIITIQGNSRHLVISDMLWVRVEIHQNFTAHFSADVNKHPQIDYSVVFCPSRKENLWEKKDLMAIVTVPLWSPRFYRCYFFLIFPSCLISFWPFPSLPIWLTWNWLMHSFTKYVLSNYYVLSIHLGTRNSDKKPCSQGAYILVEEIHDK